jgi:hypothetical protein
MNRTQIQLAEKQHHLLKKLSRSSNETVAALIREAVDQFLLTRRPDRFYLYKQAQSIVGKYEGGIPDVSVAHDRYLEENAFSLNLRANAAPASAQAIRAVPLTSADATIPATSADAVSST